MRRNGYLWTFGVNLHTAVRFPHPDVPTRVQNFGNLATLCVDFCILHAACPPHFYFRFVWPTDLKSKPHPWTHVNNSQLFELQFFGCWYAKWPCDLDLWLFDLQQLSYMTAHVSNLATKFEDPALIRSWVMSYNVSRYSYHWKCVRSHCACAE